MAQEIESRHSSSSSSTCVHFAHMLDRHFISCNGNFRESFISILRSTCVHAGVCACICACVFVSECAYTSVRIYTECNQEYILVFSPSLLNYLFYTRICAILNGKSGLNPVCLSLARFLCLPLWISVFPSSVLLSHSLSVSLSLCLPVYCCVYLSPFFSFTLSISLPVPLSTCRLVYLSVSISRDLPPHHPHFNCHIHLLFCFLLRLTPFL